MDDNRDTIVLDDDDTDTGEEGDDKDVTIVGDEPRSSSSAASAATSLNNDWTNSRTNHKDRAGSKWWVDKDTISNSNRHKSSGSAKPRPRKNNMTDRLVAARITLQVQNSEHMDKRFGISYVLYGHNAAITMGRSRALPLPRLVLTNDVEISSTHARIYLDASKSKPKLRLMDLNSSNGTKRGAADLIPKRSYVLQQGHDVLVGTTDVYVEYAETFAAFESKGNGNRRSVRSSKSIESGNSEENTTVHDTSEEKNTTSVSKDSREVNVSGFQSSATLKNVTDNNEYSTQIVPDAPEEETDKQKELEALDALIYSLQEKRRELVRHLEENDDDKPLSDKPWKPLASPAKAERGSLEIPTSRFNQEEEVAPQRSLWGITGKAAQNCNKSATKRNGEQQGIDAEPEENDIAIQGTQSKWELGDHDIEELTTNVVPQSRTDSHQRKEKDSMDHSCRQDCERGSSSYSRSSAVEKEETIPDNTADNGYLAENEVSFSEADSSQAMSQEQADISRLVGMFTQTSDAAYYESEREVVNQKQEIAETQAESSKCMNDSVDSNSVISLHSDNTEGEDQSPTSSDSFASAKDEENTSPNVCESSEVTIQSPSRADQLYDGHHPLPTSKALASRDLNQEFRHSISTTINDGDQTENERIYSMPERVVAHLDKGPPYDDPTRYSYMELKQLVTEYGLVARSREKMIEQLGQIWNYIEDNKSQVLPFTDFRMAWLNLCQKKQAAAPTGKSQSSTASKRCRGAGASQVQARESDDALARAYSKTTRKAFQSAISDDTYSALRDCIKRRTDLYDRMLAFEPVDVAEVVGVAKEDGINCPRDQIVEFLRNEGVTAAHKWQRKR